jgi:ABC-type nitrate/sulfonate/bicarbonate transport system substrate-binding protein
MGATTIRNPCQENKPMLRRRAFLAGAAAGLAGPAFAQAPAKLRVQCGWIANVEYAGIWEAIEHGYFRANGIDLTAMPGGPNAPPAAVVVASGKAEVGYTTWLPFLDAVAKGNRFVMIGATFPRSPLGIISLPKKPLRKPADLVGAKILAQGANEQSSIDATLALSGLPKQWAMVPTGFSPEPLLAGDADGYTAFEVNQTITLERMGLKRDRDFFFTSFDELGFKGYAGIAFTTQEALLAQRPVLLGYLKALVRGWQDVAADPAAAAKLVVEKYGVDYGLDLVQQTRQAELEIPLMQVAGQKGLLVLDRAAVAGPMTAAAKATGRSVPDDLDSIADFRLAEEANGLAG